MRRFFVSLPSYLEEDICYIQSEIDRLEKNLVAEDEENSIEKRHLILLIATFTEQALKFFRDDIVNINEEIPAHIKKYFELKNEKEPLYVKKDSGDSIFTSFGIDVNSITSQKLNQNKRIMFFEGNSDLVEFEKIINKNRNMAAHETQPNFTLDFSKIKRFYDYCLLFLEYYYQQLESKINNGKEKSIFFSKDTYEEYFVKGFYDGVEMIYLKKKSPKNIDSRVREEFSIKEWENIFIQYLQMDDEKKVDFLKPDTPESDFKTLSKELSEPKCEWRRLGGKDTMLRKCLQLATIAEENRNYIKFPIKIKDKEILFGKR